EECEGGEERGPARAAEQQAEDRVRGEEDGVLDAEGGELREDDVRVAEPGYGGEQRGGEGDDGECPESGAAHDGQRLTVLLGHREDEAMVPTWGGRGGRSGRGRR